MVTVGETQSIDRTGCYGTEVEHSMHAVSQGVRVSPRCVCQGSLVGSVCVSLWE